MTHKQFAMVEALAREDQDFSHADDTMIDGLYLDDFAAPKYVTAGAVARALRWQARYLNGKWDEEQIAEFRHFACRRLELLPASAAEVEELLACVKMMKVIA